jgi:hypothetical protein
VFAAQPVSSFVSHLSSFPRHFGKFAEKPHPLPRPFEISAGNAGI